MIDLRVRRKIYISERHVSRHVAKVEESDINSHHSRTQNGHHSESCSKKFNDVIVTHLSIPIEVSPLFVGRWLPGGGGVGTGCAAAPIAAGRSGGGAAPPRAHHRRPAE